MNHRANYFTYPVFFVQVQVLDLPVHEKRCQADSVVSKMWFFADDHDIVFASLGIELHQFLATIVRQPDSRMG